MTDPTTDPAATPGPYAAGAALPKGRSALIPLLIAGGVVGFAVVAIVGLVVVGQVLGGDGRSAEDTAVQWVEAFVEDDPQAAYDLITPAQRELLSYDVWDCAFESLDYTEEGVELSVIDVNGNLTGGVPGDGARDYPVTEVVVRTTNPDGSFDETIFGVVEDGGSHYIRMDRELAFSLALRGVGPVFGAARHECTR